MTVSMRVMSAGAGYKYLLHSVVVGDGNRDRTTPLTRYYQEAGTPPGRWLGAGLSTLAHPDHGVQLTVGDAVSEQHLERLIGHGCHPISGEQFGRPYFRYAAPKRTAPTETAAEPKVAQRRHPVAGYDYTFTVPKSVSVLWGLADAGTQELLTATHHAAVAEVIGFMEGEVVATRMGASSRNGAVVQADTAGVMATAYDHWDSRAGDPLLHTHVVISNKVNTIADRKWRAIDGRPMHAATVAVSELYNAVLADKLTATFGLAWQQRDRGRDRNPAWELRDIPQELVNEFSARAADITVRKDKLIGDYVAKHGHEPSRETTIRLRQQATLETRPAKELRSMITMTADWRHRATPIIGTDAIGWVSRIVDDGVRVDRRAVVHDVTGDRRHGRHAAPAIDTATIATAAIQLRDDGISTAHRLDDATVAIRRGRHAAPPPPPSDSPPSSSGSSLRRFDDATAAQHVAARATTTAAPPPHGDARGDHRSPVADGGDVPPPSRRRAVPVVLRADDVPADVANEIAKSVLAIVADKRSTWTRWNLHAEASRQLMGWRFASLADRNAITSNVVAAAERTSLRLTPDALATPMEFTRADGTSRFRPRNHELFTSQRLLDVEAEILNLSRDTSGPRIEPTNREFGQGGGENGTNQQRAVLLGDDQRDAISAVASSGRVIDVLVGPAGAGKTTALAELRRIWEAEHGAGSVVGLAPSANAAAVLGEELGIATENTAKWWYDHQHGARNLVANQLVIVDEASLAGTFSVHQIARHAAEVGAKLLLVGDHAQLQSVTAGGVFQLLVDDRSDAPELTDVHRFRSDWEKAASLQLRHANPQAFDAYEQHQRVVGGDLAAMIERAYTAWRTDIEAGRTALLIADNNDTVSALNQRARADRIANGTVDATREVALHDGLHVSRGDLIVTRQNDRRLIAGNTGWVRNGDRWNVLDVLDDGSAVVRREGLTSGGTITLPSAYVAQHVELGYAVTAQRAQGATVEAAHAIVTETTTRENLYVAMTRGRNRNHAYVATDALDDAHAAPHPDDQPQTARQLLGRVLARSGAEPSAHRAAEMERETWGSISQLGAEYETLHAAALRDRWTTAIRNALPAQQAEAAISSPDFNELTRYFAFADTMGLNVNQRLPEIVAANPVTNGEDVVDALQKRVGLVLVKPNQGMRGPKATPSYALGMYERPSPNTPLTDEMKQALGQRLIALNARADELVDRAIASGEPWLRHLGPRPSITPDQAEWWRETARSIAAYRDHYEITGPAPLGSRADLSTATPSQLDCANRIQSRIDTHRPQPTREPSRFGSQTHDFARARDYGLSR